MSIIIYANRFIRSKGWQGPVAIDAGTGDADGHQITFDADGNAAVVFEQKVSVKERTKIYAIDER